MPKRLAEIAIDASLATRDDVVRAARISDDQKVPLIVPLVRQIGVDELALVANIKRQIRISIPDPATVQHDPDAVRELSRDTCWRLRVMPLSVSYSVTGEKTLHVAMADPTDAVAIAELEHVTGCNLDTSLMPLSAIEELVDKAYKAFVTEVMPRKRTPYGGDLEVTTQPMTRVADADEDTPGDPGKPSTVPFHRVADEASLELRHHALLTLMVDKGLITMDDYREQVRALMKQQNDEG